MVGIPRVYHGGVYHGCVMAGYTTGVSWPGIPQGVRRLVYHRVYGGWYTQGVYGVYNQGVYGCIPPFYTFSQV